MAKIIKRQASLQPACFEILARKLRPTALRSHPFTFGLSNFPSPPPLNPSPILQSRLRDTISHRPCRHRHRNIYQSDTHDRHICCHQTYTSTSLRSFWTTKLAVATLVSTSRKSTFTLSSSPYQPTDEPVNPQNPQAEYLLD